MVSRLSNRPCQRSGLEAPALTVPVLALGGDHRYGPQIVAMLKEFATDVSGGSIANCAHWLPEERPGEIADAVLKFLAG